MTYQLAALLQPGICLVIDPIKSLMKDQFDNLRKKYRRIKNEKLNSGNVFSLDDTYKIDDPLLDKHARERELERVITRNMADMAHHGKEAEMIATESAPPGLVAR